MIQQDLTNGVQHKPRTLREEEELRVSFSLLRLCLSSLENAALWSILAWLWGPSSTRDSTKQKTDNNNIWHLHYSILFSELWSLFASWGHCRCNLPTKQHQSTAATLTWSLEFHIVPLRPPGRSARFLSLLLHLLSSITIIRFLRG